MSTRLLPPLLTLLAGLGFILLGLYLWSYRFVPVGITDSTGYLANDVVSVSVLLPGITASILSVIALIQRVAGAHRSRALRTERKQEQDG